MATYVVAGVGTHLSHGLFRQSWDWTTTATGFGEVVELGNYTELWVQFSGVTGGTSNISLQGAIFSTGDWVILTSVSGGALSLTDAEPAVIYEVAEHMPFIRPNVTTVTSATGPLPYCAILSREEFHSG